MPDLYLWGPYRPWHFGNPNCTAYQHMASQAIEPTPNWISAIRSWWLDLVDWISVIGSWWLELSVRFSVSKSLISSIGDWCSDVGCQCSVICDRIAVIGDRWLDLSDQIKVISSHGLAIRSQWLHLRDQISVTGSRMFEIMDLGDGWSFPGPEISDLKDWCLMIWSLIQYWWSDVGDWT